MDNGLVVYCSHHINGGFEAGEKTSIKPNVYIDVAGGVKLGVGVVIADDVVIYTHKHKFPRDIPVIECEKIVGVETKKLVIEDDVFIGTRSILLNIGHIAKGCIIGAGSVVTHDIEEEYTVWAGVPAKQIGVRE